MSKMTSCKACGAEIATSAKSCPKCGAKNKKPIWKRVWVWVLVFFMLVGSMTSTGSDKEPDIQTDSSISVESETLPEEAPQEPEDIPNANESVETMGQKNAVKKAKSYIKTMPFSYEGLIYQLEFEGFSSEEAVYGADHCEADWKEQCVEKAKDYLDLMAFSREGLADQLKFEGFTEEEIEYALNTIGY